MVQRQIVGDREQPGRELGAGPVPFACPVNPQEYLLGQVLCLLDPADQVNHDPEQPVLITVDQHLERTRDIVANLQHQADVRVARLQLLFQGLSAHYRRPPVDRRARSSDQAPADE